MKDNTVINIDYLKLYCTTGNWSDIADIKFKEQPHRSRHFKKIETVFLQGQKFAVLESIPHSSILSPKSGLLKIENKYLYSNSLGIALRYFLSITKTEIQNISRLDIAVDFNYFARGIYPEKLIQNYMQKKVLKKGRGKFTVSGQQADTNRFHYLKFGSRTSPVQVYLYNKSKEMEDVKFKNYIFEDWKHNGLNTDRNVWRLEFSLKSEATTFCDETSGEVIKLCWQDIIKADILKAKAIALIQQYFVFVTPNGQPRISRMPILKLFNFEESSLKRIRLTNDKDVTRRDKVFLKNLYFEKRINEKENPEHSARAREVIQTITENQYLKRYYHSRKIYWDDEISQQIVI